MSAPLHEPCACGHPVIDHAREYGGCRRAVGSAKCACKSTRPRRAPRLVEILREEAAYARGGAGYCAPEGMYDIADEVAGQVVARHFEHLADAIEAELA